MSDYEYPDTVRIRFGRGRGGRPLEGCGGGILPPATLDNTGWAIAEIDGSQVGGEAYQLQFDDAGRLSGQAGCNRFSGPYTQRGRTLTPGAIIATRMDCPGERMTHERKMMQVLRGPVEIGYRGGMIMTLRGAHEGTNVYVTLRRF
jgi:heat shock protein HslJ